MWDGIYENSLLSALSKKVLKNKVLIKNFFEEKIVYGVL